MDIRELRLPRQNFFQIVLQFHQLHSFPASINPGNRIGEFAGLAQSDLALPGTAGVNDSWQTDCPAACKLCLLLLKFDP